VCECLEFEEVLLTSQDFEEQPSLVAFAQYEESAEVTESSYAVYGAQKFNQFGRNPRNSVVQPFVPDIQFEYAKCGAVSCVFKYQGHFYGAAKTRTTS